MATCADIITSVQEIFGDVREVAFTRAQCLRWLSDGQQQIAKDTECFTTTALFGVSTFGASYNGHALPDDPIFMREASVEWNGVPLPRTHREDINTTRVKMGDVTSSDPTSYFIFDQKIYLWPYPQAAVSGTPLRLWFYAMPATILLEAEELSIPAALHSDLVDYCLARARERNEDPEQAGRSMQQFSERLAQSREIIFNPGGESYPVIRSDPADMY
jgi:hypothetical protein